MIQRKTATETKVTSLTLCLKMLIKKAKSWSRPRRWTLVISTRLCATSIQPDEINTKRGGITYVRTAT